MRGCVIQRGYPRDNHGKWPTRLFLKVVTVSGVVKAEEAGGEEELKKEKEEKKPMQGTFLFPPCPNELLNKSSI